MVNYTEILFIPKTALGFQNCRKTDKGYRIHSAQGEIPWLTQEEKIIAQTPRHCLRSSFDFVDHLTKILGREFEDELMRYVTDDIKTLRDLRLELDGRSVSRGLYLNVKYKSVSVRGSSEDFRTKLRNILSCLSDDIKITWSSINIKNEVTRLYISTESYLKAYHEMERNLLDSNHFALNDILCRKRFKDKAIYLKAFMQMTEKDNTLVEILVSHTCIHPYAEFNFTSNDKIDETVICAEKYNSKLSRQILGYDSPKSREDVNKIFKYL